MEAGWRRGGGGGRCWCWGWCWCWWEDWWCSPALCSRYCACCMTGTRKPPSWASRAEAKGQQRHIHTHTHTHTHTLIHNNNRTGARQLEPTGTAEKLAFCRDVTFCSSTQHTASREERGDTGWDRNTAAGLEGSGNDRPRLWVQCSAVLGGTDRCQTQTVSGNVLRVLWRAPRRAPCF